MSKKNEEDVQELIDNITEQLQELEVLTAMYPEELIMTDPVLLIDAQEYCESQGQSPVILQSLTFDLSLASENCNSSNVADDKSGNNQYLYFKLSVKLPKSYPSVERPELSIIADEMNRAELTSAKNAMNDFVSTLALGEQILLEIVMWLQENLVTFLDKDSKDFMSDTTKKIKPENDVLISMWLYMHHIYSKHKRKDIQNWSRDYDLTGFSLPGKPGVVYIEGLEANVDAYFDRLKSLPWKSIKCRTRENISTRVFEDFKELCFQPHGARNYHMDLGLFYNFLVEHGLAHMFKEIFGVEGQLKDE